MIFCVPSTCRGLGALLKAFLPLLLSVLASTSGTTSRDALSEYGAARHHLVMLEGRLAVGAALERALSAQEKVADGILRTAKRQALSPSQPDAGPPIASQHFFDAKPRIEKTLLFSLLREMPKGAVLHTHPDALPDVKWVIQHATYDSRLWVCGDVGTGQLDNPLSFQFSDQPHGPSEPWNAVAAQTRNNCAWRQVTALRNASGDESAFDQALLEDLTLLTSRRPAYRSQEDVWTKFQHCFGRISGIYYFTEYHRALMEAAFRAIRDDGVQHLEMRQTIRSRVYDLDGKLHPIDTTLENLASAANSAGISLRVQLAEMRSASSTVVAAALENASRLMTKYPGLIVGFDLVGQEDAGRPLADFLPELLQVNGNTSVFAGHAEMRKKMPFFFHAGETDQAGLPPDANLFDAVLLNSTRIGHGYSLSQHPVLRQLVAAQGIAIEVCPLSNQVLMLVRDLRDHPAPSHWVPEGLVPMTINPDGPAMWGAVGVTYDWFQFFLATGNSSGIGLLKQLILNSWTHSALPSNEVAAQRGEWERRWSTWVAAVAATVGSDDLQCMS